MCTPMPPSAGGSLPAMYPYGKVVRAMLRPATLVLMGLASAAAIAHAFWAPFPASGGNPVLDLIAYHDPGFHTVIRVWYYVAPAVAVVLFGSLGLSVWRVWLQPRAKWRRPGQAACLARVARGRGALARGRRAAPPDRSARERAALLARRSQRRGCIRACSSSAPSAPARPRPACIRSPSSSSPGRPTGPHDGPAPWC